MLQNRMSRKGSSKKRKHSVHWFRKGLRLSDNPTLLRAVRKCESWRCIFILDPWFAGSSNVGTNKWRFLLQCLEDLDSSLRKLNSRLFVVRGQPADVLPTLFREWGTTYFTFEEDPEPFGRVRDQNIIAMCKEMGIAVAKEHSHTLYNLDRIIDRNGGKAPLTYKKFQAIVQSMDLPPKPVPTLTLQMLGNAKSPISADHDEKYGVPSLEELGFDCDNLKPTVWVGGETEALSRLERHLERKAWVASFGRPKMTPQSLLASQTGVSPYLRFGCLSTRLFYHALSDLYRKIKKCEPPLSLHGQLLWREFFYCASTKNPNFDKMVGNPICVQIPWDKNDEALAKWANANTGFPWIDAIMTQLREEGWIHHLARHAVACFLTRGDLWISWEEGMKVFDELLLDADWSVNAGTWLWLSCSSFFLQFFHCYCPVKFGRKADASGDFIRRYVPILKNYPTRYIHEPWTAPEDVQKSAKCIIGVDYPKPMCNHSFVSKLNMDRMKQVYQQLAVYSQNPGHTVKNMPHDLIAQLPKMPKIGSGNSVGEPITGSEIMGPPAGPPDLKVKVDEDEETGGETRDMLNRGVLDPRRLLADRSQGMSVISTVGSVLTSSRAAQYQPLNYTNTINSQDKQEFRYQHQPYQPQNNITEGRIQDEGALPLLSGDILLNLENNCLPALSGSTYPSSFILDPTTGGGHHSSGYSYPAVTLGNTNFSNVIYSQPPVTTTSVHFAVPQQTATFGQTGVRHTVARPSSSRSNIQQQQSSGGRYDTEVTASYRHPAPPPTLPIFGLPGGTRGGTPLMSLPQEVTSLSGVSSMVHLASSDSLVYSLAEPNIMSGGIMMMTRQSPAIASQVNTGLTGSNTDLSGSITAANIANGNNTDVNVAGGNECGDEVSPTSDQQQRQILSSSDLQLDQDTVSSIPGFSTALPDQYFSQTQHK